MFLQMTALNRDGIFLIRCPVTRLSLKYCWLLSHYLPTLRNSRSNNFPCQLQLQGEEQSSEGWEAGAGRTPSVHTLIVRVLVVDHVGSGLAPGRIGMGLQVSPSHKHRTAKFSFPELCVKCLSNANLQNWSINQNTKPACSIFTQLILHMLV